MNAFAGAGKYLRSGFVSQTDDDKASAAVAQRVVTHEKDAQVTVSTAHRSKGLEWPVVMLSEDFTDITDPLLSQDETNLLYVAVTRARRTLVLNELKRRLSNEGGKNREATHEIAPSGN